MKTFTAILVASALIVPSAALAQRHTVPGQAERHAKALGKAIEIKKADEKTYESVRNDESERKQRVPAAKAGKANVAATAATAATSPN